MAKWFSGISVIVLLMIVASSIIQFHHHDDKGNIVWGVTALVDCESTHDSAHNHPTTKSHKCHCSCGTHNDNNCGSGEECTAHLGDYQIAKQTILLAKDFPIALFTAIICENIDFSATTNHYTNLISIDHTPLICAGIYCVASLRAPPMC